MKNYENEAKHSAQQTVTDDDDDQPGKMKHERCNRRKNLDERRKKMFTSHTQVKQVILFWKKK